MDIITVTTLIVSLTSGIVSILTHIKHSECCNCCKIDTTYDEKETVSLKR